MHGPCRAMSLQQQQTTTATNNKQLFVAIIKKRANFHTQPVGAACRLCWCLCVRTSALITAHYSDQSVACCQLEDTSNNVTLSPYCHCLLLLPLPTAACRLLLAATPPNYNNQRRVAAITSCNTRVESSTIKTEAMILCSRQLFLINFLILLWLVLYDVE